MVFSEGIAYGEVETYGVPEAAEVVVSAASGVVGSVDADSDVESEDEEVEVIAESGTCSKRYVAEEVAGIDGGAGAVGIGLHEPYVAASRKTAPERAPTTGKRYSALSSSLRLPTWST